MRLLKHLTLLVRIADQKSWHATNCNNDDGNTATKRKRTKSRDKHWKRWDHWNGQWDAAAVVAVVASNVIYFDFIFCFRFAFFMLRADSAKTMRKRELGDKCGQVFISFILIRIDLFLSHCSCYLDISFLISTFFSHRLQCLLEIFFFWNDASLISLRINSVGSMYESSR